MSNFSKSPSTPVVCIAFLILQSCEKRQNEPINSDDLNLISKLDGVWENGDIFVSFNKNETYFSGCIESRYIDSGYFTIDNNVVSVENPLFNTINTYTIISISTNRLNLKVNYTNHLNKKQTIYLNLNKSNLSSTHKDNNWYGKNIYYNTSLFGKVKYNFHSYYSGEKTATKGNGLKYPVSFYYITKNLTIYLMELPEFQVPTIGAWNCYPYDVQVINYAQNELGEYDFQKTNLTE